MERIHHWRASPPKTRRSRNLGHKKKNGSRYTGNIGPHFVETRSYAGYRKVFPAKHGTWPASVSKALYPDDTFKVEIKLHRAALQEMKPRAHAHKAIVDWKLGVNETHYFIQGTVTTSEGNMHSLAFQTKKTNSKDLLVARLFHRN